MGVHDGMVYGLHDGMVYGLHDMTGWCMGVHDKGTEKEDYCSNKV